jgi:hypothetical protein
MVHYIINKQLYFYLVILVFFEAGCTMKLAETYTSKQKHTLGSSSLQLNDDKTFSYRIFSEFQNDTFAGEWHLARNLLTLKITKPLNLDSLLEKEDCILYEMDPTIAKGYIKIRILVKDSIPFIFAKVFLNGSQKAVSLSEAAEVIVNDNIKKIQVQIPYIKSKTFVIKASEGNDITLLIYDREFLQLAYTTPRRKWRIRKGNLIPLNDENRQLNDKFIPTRQLMP